MEVDNLRNPRRILIHLLSLFLCLLFTTASVPPASAGRLYRDRFKYVIEGPYNYTIIEGDVVDNETGDPVSGAGVSGEIHSDKIYVDVLADENGHFRILLLEDSDHTYVLNVFAVGYDPVTITGSVKYGEQQYLRVQIQYNPFDVELAENSGSLARGYTASSYSGRRYEPFTAQRTVPVLDANGNQVYDTVEEKVLTGYVWEELVTEYRVETYTTQVPVVVPKYRTVSFISGWTHVRVGRWTIPVPIYSTQQVFDGFTVNFVQQTTTRIVPYETWETRTSTTPPDFLRNVFWEQQGNVRNLKEVYTITVRQVPRTRVETYTAYRMYDYGGTYYFFLPWESRQTTVKATPRNGYLGIVRLAVEAEDGMEATLESTELMFDSPATTTLRMRPTHASVHTVKVKAYDSNGRLVETQTYELNTTEWLPPSTSWESYVGTTTQPDFIPETRTTWSWYTQNLNQTTPLTSDIKGGQIYDGGTVGGPMTQFWTVDYMHPTRPDGTLNYLNQNAWELTYGGLIILDISNIPLT